LAERILEELERELQVRGRLQRLAISLLRDTQMTAVQVEALATPDQIGEAMRRDPLAPAKLGAAIAEGVRRFFED
jgi:N-acetylmuramoyl-L-alanine amidase